MSVRLTAKNAPLRKAISRACRTAAFRENYDHLAYRQRIRQRMADVAENGMVCIYRSGRDCDGVHYTSSTHIPVPVSIIEWIKSEDDHASWLDGPESTLICRPSSCPEGGESWGGWN